MIFEDNEGQIRKKDKILSHHDIELCPQFLQLRNTEQIVICVKDESVGIVAGFSCPDCKVVKV